MKILITGFDPFGGEPVNPALEAVKLMKDEIAGAKIIKLEIPTVFRKSVEKIHEMMKARRSFEHWSGRRALWRDTGAGCHQRR